MQIGSDESLKGDSFGGLTVSAVLTNKEQDEQLTRMGITDSKKIRDQDITFLANKVRELCKHVTKEMFPVEYNKHSLTQLLNDMHKQCADELKVYDKTATHVVDKYPGCKVGDIAETKAESKYPSVAAASILARERALQQFDKLSHQLGIKVPKGSTHVADALEYLKKSGKDPNLFVKMHFKNVQKALK